MTTQQASADSSADIDVSLLEPVLQRLVGAVGVAATLRLVERCAGFPAYFPEHLDEDHWLVQLVGMAEAREVCKTLGPSEHHILPSGAAALRDLRNRQIHADRRAGATVREIGRRHGLRRRAVYNALAAGCGQLGQHEPDLFD